MNKEENQIHMAAQYLAAAGKNYIEHKSDDSHTNLGWIESERSYKTHKFRNGDYLSFNPESLILDWRGDSS